MSLNGNGISSRFSSRNSSHILFLLNRLPCRDDSLETVKRNRDQYGLPLTILSYEELYGWTMDKIVDAVGRKNNCTFCGVFRRQALDRAGMRLKVDQIVSKLILSLALCTQIDYSVKR